MKHYRQPGMVGRVGRVGLTPNQAAATPAPPASGDALLLVNGTDEILLVNGTDTLLRVE